MLDAEDIAVIKIGGAPDGISYPEAFYPEGVNLCCTGIRGSGISKVTLGNSFNLYGSKELRC